MTEIMGDGTGHEVDIEQIQRIADKQNTTICKQCNTPLPDHFQHGDVCHICGYRPSSTTSEWMG